MIKLLIIFLLICSNSYASTDYTQDANAVVVWSMDTSDDPVPDDTGKGHTGTRQGATHATASPPKVYSSGYYVYDGTNDEIFNTSVASADIADMTLLCWFRVPASLPSVDGTIIMTASDKSSGNSAANLHFSSADAKIEFRYRFDGTVGRWTVDDAISGNTWYHVAVTYNRSSTSNDPIIYVDGSSVAITEDVTPVGNPKTGTDVLLTGENVGGASDYEGDITQVAWFTRILSSAEINEILDDGLKGALSRIQGATLSGSTIN